MSRTKIIQNLVLIFLFSACFLDIWTFASHVNFLSLEANPIFNLWGLVPFLIIKILINVFIAWFFLYIWKKPIISKFYKFSITYLVLIIMVSQFTGAYINNNSKELILEDLQAEYGEEVYTDLNDVTKEIVEETYSLKQEERVTEYMYFAILTMFLPIFITLLSFKLWELMYFSGEIK